eukprot:4912338-Alexandrium_andersonii.AAC.1
MSASLVGSEMCIRDRQCSGTVARSGQKSRPLTNCARACDGNKEGQQVPKTSQRMEACGMQGASMGACN